MHTESANRSDEMADISRSHDMERLYLEAFSRFGTPCLWHLKPVETPNAEHLRIVARALKREGWKEEYAFARRLESMCDAIDRPSEAHPSHHLEQ
ncbi:MAG: hypothetical protein OXE86_00370 [Alphaproteobacteria bacterium]|nr:hypothetical protein [Alphaproteobacteria bacterium]